VSGNSFLQGSSLFTYSGTNCIRNDYFHNDCHICVDICPEGAFHIVRNRLTLFDNECIECAACIGSCPSEALHVKSFDPNAFTASIQSSEALTLSCKNNTPCLGVFDAHHMIAMALESSVTCDMSHCAECSLNKEGKVEQMIRAHIAQSNDFFKCFGVEAEILTLEEKVEKDNSRRALFRAAIEKVKESSEDPGDVLDMSMTRTHQKRNDLHVPLKHLQLKSAVKKHISRFNPTKSQINDALFFDKEVVFESCTNCGDCVQFCPTHALQTTPDKQGLILTAGSCIGCGICDDICKTDAIRTKTGYDLVHVVFDRSQELVHYEMVMCHECRCPYPYRGGDPICDRCKDFKSGFDTMFTLARDL